MGQCSTYIHTVQIEAALQEGAQLLSGPFDLDLAWREHSATHVARSASIVADPRAQTLKNQAHSSTGSTCGLLDT